MATIYLVTDGEYSDYRVLGVYSTEEKAEAARNLWVAENAIEEYELDAMSETPPGLFPFEVSMDAQGNTKNTRRVSVEFFKPENRPYGDDVHVDFRVWATDQEHAIKIANEHRTQLIAMNQWTASYPVWLARKQKNNPSGA